MSDQFISDQPKDQSEVAVTPTEDKDLDAAIDSSLNTLPLELKEKELIAKIVEAPTRDELQKQFDLFNMNQSKKNALRVVKLNSLLDKVEDQAIARFEKRPDQISNRELLEYINVISGQIDRAQKHFDAVTLAPAKTVAAQKTDVTINVGTNLNRDSKERVMDAISALLKQVRNATETSASATSENLEAPIEVDFEDKTESNASDENENKE